MSKGDLGKIRCIRRWTGAPASADKVPSLMAYTGTHRRWGFQVRIEPNTECCAWFKLALDADANLTDLDDGTLNTRTSLGIFNIPGGMTVQQVVTHYFTEIYNHTISTISQELRNGPMPALTFWLTVPATWSTAADTATKTAAVKAGFDATPGSQVVLMKEPEAALYYALKSCNLDMKVWQPHRAHLQGWS